MKKKLTFAVFRSLTMIIFIVVSIAAIFFAYGYRIDFSDWSIVKTSIIDVAGPKTDALISLDGVQRGEIMPFQISNVLPGTHRVAVLKRGFHEWARHVEVEEDVVSILRDVLLVPRNLEQYKEAMVTFQKEDRLIFGDGYLLVQRAPSDEAGFVENELEIILFEDQGEISEELISFYEENFEVLNSYGDKDLFLGLENSSFAFLSLGEQTFELFSLPSTVETIEVESDSGRLFFKESGNLYTALISELSQDLDVVFQADNYQLLYESVDDYALASNGNVFFLSEGMLYEMIVEEELVSLVDLQPQEIDHFEYYRHGAVDLIVLFETADSEEGMLAFIDERTIEPIAEEVRGKPFVDFGNTILFLQKDGILSFYDSELEEKEQIRIFEGDIDLFGWYDGFGHYLYRKDDQLFVADIYNENEIALLSEAGELDQLFVKDGALFWLAENEEVRQLTRLYWMDSF